MKDKIPRIRSRKEDVFVTIPFATFPYLLALAEEEGYEFTYIIPAGIVPYDTDREGANIYNGQEERNLDVMYWEDEADEFRKMQLPKSIMLSPHGNGISLTVDAEYVDLADVVPADILAQYYKEQAERDAAKDFYYLNIDRELIFVKAKINQKDLLKANKVLWQMEEEVPLIEAFPETGANAYKVLVALNLCIVGVCPADLAPIEVLRDPVRWREKISQVNDGSGFSIGYLND